MMNNTCSTRNEGKKRKRIALFTTLVFHGLLLLCFIFMGLTYLVPPPPEYGIEVDMGGGGGGGSSTVGKSATANPPSLAASTKQLLTQDAEQTTSLDAQKTKPAVVPVPVSQSQPAATPQPDPTPTINPNALFKKGNSHAGTGGSGTGDGTGEGSGYGSGSGSGSGNGIGSGYGNSGGDFYLNGRPVVNKAFPKSKNNLEGVVKVEFRADPQGNVTYAKAGARGTNINDPQIWKECEEAASRSKFKAKPDANTEEKGVITYRFILQ
jgi:hypothetical protein